MAPDRSRQSIDGFHRPIPKGSVHQPDYRPDHELPAPEPTPLIREHEPETTPAEPAPPSVPPPTLIVEPSPESPNGTKMPNRRGWKKWLFTGLIVLVVAAIIVVVSAFAWYQAQLAPVSTDTAKRVKVIIPSGTSPSKIGDLLVSAGVIRSHLAFSIYTKLSGTENTLKAGAYSLQPSLSTQAIVEHLVEGKQDTYRITFLPGDTLANDRQALIASGFNAVDVDAALNKSYDRPLFDTKPAGTDLEGYLYGETIEFDMSASVETILNRFFDEYQAVITDNNLVAGFQRQGLTLYEGITLASIVQRETSNPDSQAQVARIFLNRMAAGMTLGSDVTYQYAAKKLGVAPDPKLDSPYNTRIHAGLPPGPIATPGKSALLSVANPANNDYLFFLAGDDNVMHYAKTDAEHQQNIIKYCQQKCATP
jgi:UPF0755 protein